MYLSLIIFLFIYTHKIKVSIKLKLSTIYNILRVTYFICFNKCGDNEQ